MIVCVCRKRGWLDPSSGFFIVVWPINMLLTITIYIYLLNSSRHIQSCSLFRFCVFLFLFIALCRDSSYAFSRLFIALDSLNVYLLSCDGSKFSVYIHFLEYLYMQRSYARSHTLQLRENLTSRENETRFLHRKKRQRIVIDFIKLMAKFPRLSLTFYSFFTRKERRQYVIIAPGK